jgi:hypothetical protein
MSAIEHPMMNHKIDKELKVAASEPVRDTVVLTAKDEELIAKAMQAENLKPDVEKAVVEKLQADPVVTLDLKKRKALEDILFFSKPYTKEVNVGTSLFKFKLMNGIDGDEVIERLSKLSSLHQVSKASRMTLANTIISVNDVPLEDLYDGDDPSLDSLTKRYYIITKWPSSLISKLYNVYESILKEFDSKFPIDFLDKSQMTPTID